MIKMRQQQLLSPDANLETITDSIRSVQEMRNLKKRKNFRECSLGFDQNKVSHKIDNKQANLVEENTNAADNISQASRTQKKLFEAYMNQVIMDCGSGRNRHAMDIMDNSAPNNLPHVYNSMKMIYAPQNKVTQSLRSNSEFNRQYESAELENLHKFKTHNKNPFSIESSTQSDIIKKATDYAYAQFQNDMNWKILTNKIKEGESSTMMHSRNQSNRRSNTTWKGVV